MSQYRCFSASVLSFAMLAPALAGELASNSQDITKLAQAAHDAAQAAALAAKAAATAAEAANKAVAALEAMTKKEAKAEPTDEEKKEQATKANHKDDDERVAGTKFFSRDAGEAKWIYVSSLNLGADKKFIGAKEPSLRFYRMPGLTPVRDDLDNADFTGRTYHFETNDVSKLGLKEFEPGREIWTEGQEVRIGYIRKEKKCDPAAPGFVTFTENERDTLIERQARKLASTVLSKGDKANAGDNTYCIYADSYTTVETRANLVVDVKGAGADDKKGKSTTIITGPTEHWFLSADARISKVNELRYDSSTKSVMEKKKSGNGYLGVNYMIGDVLTDHGIASLDNVGVKLLVNAHDKPLDSIGMGLSYQFKANILGTDKPVSFAAFAAYFRQKGGNGARDTGKWGWGLSYNLVAGEKPKEAAAKETKK